MPITARQITLVQRSFAKVEPIAATAGKIFYAKLFSYDPSLRRLFKRDMDEQGRMIMKVLSAAVASLNDLEGLVQVLQRIAEQHVKYGVKADDYTPVGNALLHAWRRQIHRYKHTHTHAQGRLPIAPAAHLGGRRGAGELRKGHDDCTRRAKIDVVTKANDPTPLRLPYLSIEFLFLFFFSRTSKALLCHQWVANKDADVDADGAPSACWGISGLGTCAARAPSDAPASIPPRASCRGGSWSRLSARAAHGRGQPADRR